MDWNIVLGASGVMIGIAGLAYAIYATRRNLQTKQLTYEILSPMPIAHVMSKGSSYSLKIVYEKEGETPTTIDRAVLHYVRFTNFGRTAIRGEDITDRDPLRIAVRGSNLLDISITNVTRNVCDISLSKAQKSENEVNIPIKVSFLDHNDGALIQLVTDSTESDISIKGTIIGMPNGLIEIREKDREAKVAGWGCLPAAALQLIAIAAVPLLYWKIVGTWKNIWLMILPIGAIILPAALAIIFASLFNPLRSLRFPKLLTTPTWYSERHKFYGIGSPPSQQD